MGLPARRQCSAAATLAEAELALALMLRLRDDGDRLPDAAFTFSAVTDLTCSGESMKTRAAVDPLINPALVSVAAALYLGDADPRDPHVSPVFGDFKGLPPLLLQVAMPR
jgi:epsilon-lactone hydrolase